MIALISVSDKTGIVDFAGELRNLGVDIISTGGTAKTLMDAGIQVNTVSDITGFPEIMDGRVKTLHPKIHGGLLGVLDNPQHVSQMEQHGIRSIDLLVVNLYPFEATLNKEGATHEEIVENIDIGGPAMVRAGAKNYLHTCVVVNPARYADVLAGLQSMVSGQWSMVSSQWSMVKGISFDLREQLALEAYAHTAQYDARIAGYFARKRNIKFPDESAVPLRIDQSLRYGENPHQQAALYGTFTDIFEQVHGKELSYNNILDIDGAAKLCLEFDAPTVCIIKHNNPCGVGSGTDLSDAWQKAFATDTVSPFGGIVAVNRPIDATFAQSIHSIFTEVIIAPSFTDDALVILRKKKERRLIISDADRLRKSITMDLRSVAGGYLMQDSDTQLLDETALRVVTERKPTEQEHAAMMFAWRIAKHVKSNAIVYALADRTLGIGAGQMSRIDSARIAVSKANDVGLSLTGCAVASDAFFPFADGLLQAAEAGATCVIQPGGSVRDEEVIAAANEKNLAMIFTGMRHFRH